MKRSGFSIFATLLIASTAAAPGHAGEIYEFYNGARTMAMGGAYVTTVNDETAIFQNPAGLGKLRDPFFTIVDPEIDISANMTDFVRLDNFDNLVSLQGLLELLNRNPGKHFHSRYQMSPSIVLPNFGIGILANWKFDGEVDASGTDFSFRYQNDWAGALAYNLRLWDGIIKIGVSGKFINRAEVVTTVPANSTGLKVETLASEGMGVGVDGALVLTAPVKFLPSLGAIVRDIGHTSFTMTDGMLYQVGDNRPASQKQKIDVGFSLSPIMGRATRATLAAELHDVMTDDDAEAGDLMRRFHGGLEVNIRDFFFLRGGYNQKFWTAGFEFASERFQLQGTAYGEDIGAPNNPREDRRYIGKFSLRF